jgi:hypothetical protein
VETIGGLVVIEELVIDGVVVVVGAKGAHVLKVEFVEKD